MSKRLAAYVNVPQSIGLVVSMRLATLTELSTSLGAEDLHDLVEIALVDAHNRRVMAEP